MTATPAPPRLDEHLCFKLYSTSLKMTQIYKPILAALRLTYPQYLVMVVLWEEEGIGIKDIAERLQQDSGSITPLVKRLETEGYLIRNRNPNDERNRVLTLTKAGKALRQQGLVVSRQIAEQCGISASVAGTLMADLDVLNANLASRADPDA
ncbi:MAG: MarR family transcriptional regulator [Pseudomonadota bacterium]